jgi:hypothetical protein
MVAIEIESISSWSIVVSSLDRLLGKGVLIAFLLMKLDKSDGVVVVNVGFHSLKATQSTANGTFSLPISKMYLSSSCGCDMVVLQFSLSK